MQDQEQTVSGGREHAAPGALVASAATPHICVSCSRRFVVVSGGAGHEVARCPCGGDLLPASLAAGLYEVKRAKRRPAPRKSTRAPKGTDSAVPVEADQGYNESHGYGPAHGGPTGPGDAPADAPELPLPPPANEDEPAP